MSRAPSQTGTGHKFKLPSLVQSSGYAGTVGVRASPCVHFGFAVQGVGSWFSRLAHGFSRRTPHRLAAVCAAPAKTFRLSLKQPGR